MHGVETRLDPAEILIDFDNFVQENDAVTCQYLTLEKNKLYPQSD